MNSDLSLRRGSFFIHTGSFRRIRRTGENFTRFRDSFGNHFKKEEKQNGKGRIKNTYR